MPQAVDCAPPRANGSALLIALNQTSTPDQLLARVEDVERKAYTQVSDDLSSRCPTAAWSVRIHKDAARNLLDVRAACLRAAEHERSLIPESRIREWISKRHASIANLVKAMPRSLAPRIAQQPIEHVERELTDWVKERFLKTLHAGDDD
jgi:hypothetical protein